MSKISHQVCYHEAGHAFMTWYLGFRLRKVSVLSHRKLARQEWITEHRGKLMKDVPAMSEYFEDLFSAAAMYNKISYYDLRRRTRERIMIALSGPINTAKCARLSLDLSLNTTGRGDLQMISNCRLLGGVSDKNYDQILDKTCRILGTQRAEAAMYDIVGALLVSGRISGDRVEMFCLNRFGFQNRGRDLPNFLRPGRRRLQ